MSYKTSRSLYFKEKRSGIFYTLILLVLFIMGYASLPLLYLSPVVLQTPDVQKLRAHIDSIEKKQTQKRPIFAFNPNYISPYKAYTLGISARALEKLQAYRKTGRYVNSAAEFQKITQIPDTLLQKIAPYFKFPDWVVARQRKKQASYTQKKQAIVASTTGINSVTLAQLMQIPNIKSSLATRIITFRDKLGGFIIKDQLQDVYGLSFAMAKRILQRHPLYHPAKIAKQNINEISYKKLQKNMYLNADISRKIIIYRSKVGNISSFSELSKIEGFPLEKISRIELYLTLN